ncbi:polysaccharide biosynthesis tyrosine autokinase [Leptolyngbya sp. FACHB-17]|uniref:GumC family protein n=1 Tax=unclassified Leptolyngbya TaxID=2650499 RepID=UPI0016814A9E|nr:polysaccharide biosynthesis tyrosine autokinase [Leptolyngbya sp. FACHB-17]
MMQSPQSNSLSTIRNGSTPAKPLSVSPPGSSPNKPEEKDFRQHLQMVRRRWLAMSTVGIAAFSFFVWRTLTTQPVYEGGFRLLVEPINQPNRNISSLTGDRPASENYDYDTQIQVLQSPELLFKTIERLKPLQPQLSYRVVRSGLTIKRVPRTKILEIRYQSGNSTEIRAVLEQLLKDYLAYSVNERQSDLNQGLKFVESQVASAQGRVDQLQRQLQAFRQNYQLIEPDSAGGQVTAQADQIKQRRSTLEQEIRSARASIDSLRGETGAIVALNNSQTYQALIQQLQGIESKIALESTRFGDESAAIQDLKDKRGNLRGLLREEARKAIGFKAAELLTQLQGLEMQQQALVQSERALSQQFQQLPVLSRQYTDLQRELKIATTSLERFLETREKLQVEASQKKLPWQVMEPPPAQAALVSPNVSQDLTTGAAISVALAIAAALLLEKVDASYRNVGDLKKASAVPVLGQIPHEPMIQTEREWKLLPQRTKKSKKGKKKRIKRLEDSTGTVLSLPITSFHEDADPEDVSEFSEAFRILRANLQQLNPGHPVRSLVVSSADVGDGKSTVALYLAQTIAEMGQRVLLVDADFRRSQLQKRLQLSDDRGLSQVLFENVEVQDVIQQPFADLPFYVLGKGSNVSDPVRVLTSPRMPELKLSLTQSFDFVVYDAPPLDDIADAMLLTPHTDGLLLVVRLQKTERVLVTKTLDNLAVSGIPALGIVVNDI